MPAFPREEIEEMLRRWIAGNSEGGRTGRWGHMSEFYTEDALYTWNNGPDWEFAARGRQEIHDWVFGSEMAGLEHWTYPYVRTLIDEKKGEVLGVWRQIAPDKDPDGNNYEIAGTGGSWFRYAGDYKWSWQRDFFDHMNAGNVFLKMAEHEQLRPAMIERMGKGSKMPGWTRRAGFDWYTTVTDRED